MAELENTADEVLTASRALLAVVARSVAPILEQITLPQFRALVILSNAHEQVRSGDIAVALGVHPSTFTRTSDRLVSAGWVTRSENPENRRETLIALTPEGSAIVDQVTENRRREITAILVRLDAGERDLVLRAMALFADAAGEPHVRDLVAMGV